VFRLLRCGIYTVHSWYHKFHVWRIILLPWCIVTLYIVYCQGQWNQSSDFNCWSNIKKKSISLLKCSLRNPVATYSPGPWKAEYMRSWRASERGSKAWYTLWAGFSRCKEQGWRQRCTSLKPVGGLKAPFERSWRAKRDWGLPSAATRRLIQMGWCLSQPAVGEKETVYSTHHQDPLSLRHCVPQDDCKRCLLVFYMLV
jgi:hypothetical protein